MESRETSRYMFGVCLVFKNKRLDRSIRSADCDRRLARDRALRVRPPANRRECEPSRKAWARFKLQPY